MASISLRAYNKEIEGLIVAGQAKDAIVHCRHILRQFPKHIETYRLLGKAYLESQRYTEAADVLQRVLSCLPDDFISQIGMSVIREDEGNLDAAIFHMERAFEAQPSNSAVQDELKRLYGRRDGVVPSKIRLTRGALVRMYARGDLYQQAIAEARVSLVENPDRVELEVILARMYFLSGQKVPATEVASRLIEKLPYCYEANRILAEVLPGTSRAEDAAVYRQRLVALDPYLAHVSPGSATSEAARDDVVTLAIFDGEAEEEPAAQPDWAQSVGVKMEESTEEPLPDWLLTPETEVAAPETAPAEEQAQQEPAEDAPVETPQVEAEAEFTEPEAPAESTEEREDLPDWMQAAGWQPSSGEFVEGPAAEELEEVAADLTESEVGIPEWLQEMAPEGEPLESAGPIEEPTGAEDNSWLESILADAETKSGDLTGLEFAAEEEIAAEEPLEVGEELPADLGLEFLGEIEAPAPAASESEELPDWLAGLAEIEASADDSQVAPVVPAESDDDWLDIFAVKGEEAPAAEGEPVEEAVPPAAEITGLPEREAEDFLAAFEAAPVDPDATQPSRVRRPEEEPAGVVPPVEAFQPEQSPAEEFESFEEDFSEVEEPALDETVIPAAPVESAAPRLMDEEDLSIFDFIEPEEEKAAEAPAMEEEFEAEEEETSVPEWLKESLEKGTGEGAEESGAFEFAETEPAGERMIEEVAGEAAEGEEAGAEVDDDAAFAWLEALAARQGAEEETLEHAPEERSTEPPEWVKIEAEQDVIGEEELAEFAEPEEPVESPEVEPEISLEEDELSPAATFETPVEEPEPPAWASEEESAPAGEPEIAAAAEVSAGAEKLPEWLSETLSAEEEAVEEEDVVEAEPAAHPPAGAWQPEEMEAAESAAPAEETAGAPAELETAFEEASEQVETPASEPVAEVPVSEDTEPEEVPDWLRGLAEEPAGAAPTTPPDTETPPDWLKDLEKEESGIMPETTYSASTGQTGYLKKQQQEAQAAPVEDTSPVRVSPAAPQQPAAGGADDLYNAQAALNTRNIDGALNHYNRLIGRGEALEDIIHDLRDAVYRFPVDVNIWQSLGDAYMRSNQLQEALDAYTKAEELLR